MNHFIRPLNVYSKILLLQIKFKKVKGTISYGELKPSNPKMKYFKIWKMLEYNNQIQDSSKYKR